MDLQYRPERPHHFVLGQVLASYHRKLCRKKINEQLCMKTLISALLEIHARDNFRGFLREGNHWKQLFSRAAHLTRARRRHKELKDRTIDTAGNKGIKRRSHQPDRGSTLALLLRGHATASPSTAMCGPSDPLLSHVQAPPKYVSKAGSGTLSVLTLNVWVNEARQNLQRQIKAVRDLDPDIICLQEVFAVGVLQEYKDAFPEYETLAFGRGITCKVALMLLFLASLWALLLASISSVVVAGLNAFPGLRTMLPLQDILTCVSFIGSLLVAYRTPHCLIDFFCGNLTGCVLLVRRTSLRIDNGDTCKYFSKSAHRYDFLNALRPRGIIHVKGKLSLGDGSDELDVQICTSHLNQPISQPQGEGRHKQIQEVQEALGTEGLAIFACDLNATPPGWENGSECHTYKMITEELEDAWVAKHEAEANLDATSGATWDQASNALTRNWQNRIGYGKQIMRWRCDYIFWRCNWQPSTARCSLRSCDVVFTGEEAVSDHFGVFAVFDLLKTDNMNQAIPVAAPSATPVAATAA